jgi:hypothetical protein
MTGRNKHAHKLPMPVKCVSPAGRLVSAVLFFPSGSHLLSALVKFCITPAPSQWAAFSRLAARSFHSEVQDAVNR